MSNYWNKMSPMNSLLNERVGKAKGGKILPKGLRGKAKRKGKGPHRKTEEEVLKKAYPGQFRNENNEYTLTPKKNTKGKAKGGRIGLRDRVFRDGGKVNTSRENRLEELGRVDSEKKFAKSKRGKANLSDEKRRIVRELRRRG